MVTSSVLDVWPVAIVSVAPVSVKSASVAGTSGTACTVTGALDGPLSVAVTVLTPPSSGIDTRSSDNVTVGAPSSSTIVSVRFGASTVLPTAVTRTSPVTPP